MYFKLFYNTKETELQLNKALYDSEQLERSERLKDEKNFSTQSLMKKQLEKTERSEIEVSIKLKVPFNL